jgi:hypothetical protein
MSVIGQSIETAVATVQSGGLSAYPNAKNIACWDSFFERSLDLPLGKSNMSSINRIASDGSQLR